MDSGDPGETPRRVHASVLTEPRDWADSPGRAHTLRSATPV
jgi:hypothetical protein